ncbi:Tripeptidyl-peptidase sed2 [Penicillium riverlandense]|uniref:Tripeptidyl-peptidase sed2 n=1 Tax=Penicillium riverlandense TaxID=1903569 RepID=UPI0025466666|nr:Tripeptidyl-peptidase sed2 [Penicillium riverlandense]KAJ5819571.1 Tripeptidyl-peptidase sed2 [Penicillium riverlandense]
MLGSLLNRGALSLTVVLLLTSSAVADVFEKLTHVPQGWIHTRSPRGNQPIRLQIALAQSDVEGFEKAVMDMSTPGNANYGNHFQTHEEMKRMLQPSSDAVDSVRAWLEDAGITQIEQDADWISFETTVNTANELLDANFQYYMNRVKHVERLRTLEYSIPDSLTSHINLVAPTTRFGQLHAERSTMHTKSKRPTESFRKATADGDCNNSITPQCLKQLYKVDDYEADTGSGSKVGFASYLEQYARFSDLELFEKNIAPYAKNSFSVVTYHGGENNQSYPGDASEANLDAQYIVGMSSPIPVTEFSTGGRGPLVPDSAEPSQNNDQNEPYLEFLQNVLKMDKDDLPQVISTSYGEDEQSVPEKYARSVCNLFTQLGSRGVSVLFSSGDSGVGGDCVTNDGSNRTHFLPQFPAACPWVTSVGATTHMSPESAVSFSSGGFSDVWERPSYQNDAVSAYLEVLGDQYAGLFNPKGRAFPDVAAQGANFAVYSAGSLVSLEGTSCSCPTFAGVIALLNDARLRANKPVMGFLNPWIYANGASVLNDITTGGSTGCSQGQGISASWNATKGWDPVTGLGTPNFAEMKKVAVGN